MHGEIDPAVEHGIVDLLGEQGTAADADEGDLLDQVARGPDLDPLGLVAG
jgi:hypothetical protein